MTMRRDGPAGLVMCAALLFAAGCAIRPTDLPPPPQSYAVLMNNADGTTGRLSVATGEGEVVVNQHRHGVNLDGSFGAPYAVDEARIKKDFGQVLAALPEAPVSFVVYFEPGGGKLTAQSQALIPKVLAAARNRDAPDVSVIAHADGAGNAEAGENLALLRARAVADLISKAGLKAHGLTVTSHGALDPLIRAPAGKPEPRNNRVEIIIR